jgi:hypothetical protein
MITMIEEKKVVPIRAQDEPEPAPVSTEPEPAPVSIAKPGKFSLDKFKSKLGGGAGVDPLPGVLPVLRASEAKDFIRLHDDDAYWSPELCFVQVPIKGQQRDTLHLIDPELAALYLSPGEVIQHLLVLASKPHDNFFLCGVPSRNLENAYNQSNLAGCMEAKSHWVQIVSRRAENVEGYSIRRARDVDAFAAPNWPKQSLVELIEATFSGRMIETEDHPALLRKIGARQSMA